MRNPHYSDYDDVTDVRPLARWCERHQMPYNEDGCPDCLDIERQNKLQILRRVGQLTRQERRERLRQRRRESLTDALCFILYWSLVSLGYVVILILLYAAWRHR